MRILVAEVSVCRFVGIVGLTLLSLVLKSHAATLIPIPVVPGSASTVVSGINNRNVVAGWYDDSAGGEHGFFGTLAGDYTTFDVPGKDYTDALGISDDGHIVGQAGNQGKKPTAFLRNPDGSIVPIVKRGIPLAGAAAGINTTGAIVGYYLGKHFSTVAYEGKNGTWRRDISPFGSDEASANGIAGNGDIAGNFYDSSSNGHGFVLREGIPTQLDYPGAFDTVPIGINRNGIVSGSWFGQNYQTSGAFLLNLVSDTITDIVISGATLVQAAGINDKALVVIDSDAGNFIYCPRKPRKCPSGGFEIGTQQQKFVRNVLYASDSHNHAKTEDRVHQVGLLKAR